MEEKMHIYYDKESDYLEIRFGEPTESRYEKIGPDMYVRIEEKTDEKKGYAIFNVRKGTSTLTTIDLEIPASVFNALNKSKKVEAK